MAAIVIGYGTFDGDGVMIAGYTALDLNVPANGTGTITTFQAWFNTNATGVKIGTFYGSGTSWTRRDYEAIGNVTAGSTQTFSGLSCDVTTSDNIGMYAGTGDLERYQAGGTTCILSGDQFDAGTKTYTAGSRIFSIYGTGATGITQKSLIGTLNLAGALSGILKIFESLAGTLDLSGALATVFRFSKSLSGALNSVGSLAIKALIKKAGTVNFSGLVNRKISLLRIGTLNMSGAVSTILKIFKSIAGSLSFAGIMSLLIRIIGAGNVSIDNYLPENVFHLSKFIAEFSGIISEVKVYSNAPADIKVAVYSDVGGEPSSLLSVVNTPTAVVAGWNTIAIPNISLTIGTSYWLAFNSG